MSNSIIQEGKDLMDHFTERKHLKEVAHIPMQAAWEAWWGKVQPVMPQPCLLRSASPGKQQKLERCSSPSQVKGLKPLPGMSLERRTNSLGAGTSSVWGAEQNGEHVAEGVGIVEVFSLHDHPGEQAQQETKRIPDATKYQVLRFHFHTLLA